MLFSIIPEARYEINIIKNSIEPSPPEKLTGKVKTFPLAEASVYPPVQEYTQVPTGRNRLLNTAR